MRALRLEFKEHDAEGKAIIPPGLIDASPLDPCSLSYLDDRDLFSTTLRIGAENYELGDLYCCLPQDGFRQDGQPLLTLEGCDRYFRLGAQLSDARIVVEGNAGSHTGCGMTGGSIQIDGHAGSHLGAEMTGGEIHVAGDAGDCVGGALPGSTRGMRGGEIAIHGRAGDLLGHRMRRGFIGVRGAVGRMPGYAMLAGTIIVGEGALDTPGVAMKRGTIVSLDRCTQAAPGFFEDGPTQAVFWRVLAKRLLHLDLVQDESILEAKFRAYSGDAAVTGRGRDGCRGELLVRF